MKPYEKNVIYITLLSTLQSVISTPVVAAEDTDLQQEILNLKHKVERLEKSRQATEPPRMNPLSKMTFSGLVEVEAGYLDGPEGSESDLTVATVELGIEVQPTPWVNAHVMLLAEEDETEPPEIDEAIFTLANSTVSPWSLAAGRMVVPFGNFDSGMISDPLTLEIGETRETALQLGYVTQGFHALAYLFNGDTQDGGHEAIDQFGIKLGYAHDGSDTLPGLDLGISWISNLTDSNSLQETIVNPINLQQTVPGWSANATLHWNRFTLISEYVTAAETFSTTDLAFNGTGAKPSAWNLELDTDVKIGNHPAALAVALQQTSEATALSLPETRWLVGLSVEIQDNTTLAMEIAHDTAYDEAKGGNGEATDTLTIQLAVAF